MPQPVAMAATLRARGGVPAPTGDKYLVGSQCSTLPCHSPQTLPLGRRSKPAAVALLIAARHAPPFREVSDGAILEIYTLEAVRGRLLVGPYSRFGWHHPGPLYFYLLAPWYWLSGVHTAGMQAGALAINLSATLLVAWTGASVASGPTAIALSVLIAGYTLRTGDLMVSAWNPHVIVLPLVAYVVLAAALSSAGRRAHLLWLVVVGTFLAQTHLATVPIVALLGAGAVWNQRVLVRQWWAPAAGLTLLLWLPPLIDQAIHRPGNLASIAMFFARGGRGQDFATAAVAWASALTAAFRPGFDMAIGLDYAPTPGWILPLIALVLVALAIALALRIEPRTRFEARLLLMSAAASIVALASATRIQDRIVDHEVFWMSAIGVMNVAAMVGGAAALVGTGQGRGVSQRWTSAATAVALVTIVLVGANGMRHVLERRRTTDDHSVDVLTDRIEQYIRSQKLERPLFQIDPPIWPIAVGALLQIDKLGMSYAVGERWQPMFGDRFAPTGREDGAATITGTALQPVLITTP